MLNDRFSKRDVLVALAATVIIIVLAMPMSKRHRRINLERDCVLNLSEIEEGFLAFSYDHNSRFPANVPRSEGGSAEFTNADNTFRHFMAAIPWMNTPDHLNTNKPLSLFICPVDIRKPSTGSKFSNSNLSYFVSLDAFPRDNGAILFGDRNLTNLDGLTDGIINQRHDSRLHWGQGMHSRHLRKPFGLLNLVKTFDVYATDRQLQSICTYSPIEVNRLSLPK